MMSQSSDNEINSFTDSSSDKTLRLFGFDLNPNNNNNSKNKIDDGINSSNITMSCNNTDETKKLFRCQFCSKGFRNSQALGGHQNAHKKERRKKKKKTEDQIKAKRDGLYCYNHLLPFQEHSCLNGFDPIQDPDDFYEIQSRMIRFQKDSSMLECSFSDSRKSYGAIDLRLGFPDEVFEF